MSEMESTSVPSHPESAVESPPETRVAIASTSPKQPTAASLFLSTFLSLVVVLVLLVALRTMLPSLLEFSRYAWHRGQLRAEYEMAGQQLERVSWEGLNSVSQTVAKRISPSVVHITMSIEREELDPSLEEMVRTAPRRSKVGQGSGIIVDKRGHILTNYHVLDDGSQINVTLADERTCVAELIGFDKLTDLAVLKINASDLFPICWGDSDKLEIGSPVWAVGSPFGLTGSVTFGILSSKHRLDLSGTSYEDSIRNPLARGDKQKASPRYSDLMQSDVAVNPGNSGGPLVNSGGEMIGVNTAIIGESYRGVSFSIPSNVAKNVVMQILETGKMKRGWIGMGLEKASDKRGTKPSKLSYPVDWLTESDDESISDEAKLPIRGAVVRSIMENSPASLSGIRVGDTIREMNCLQIKGVEDLIFAIGKSSVGSKVVFTIDRNGKAIQVETLVGERPDLP